MHTQTHTLPRFSDLPAFNLRPATTPSRESRRRIVPVATISPALWRESLTVMDEPYARLEAWAFTALALLSLPALALGHLSLWRLLSSGSLDRVVQAFLLPLG